MSLLVNIGPNAQDFLDKLPKEVSLRIINKLESIKENPVRFLQHYEGNFYMSRITFDKTRYFSGEIKKI